MAKKVKTYDHFNKSAEEIYGALTHALESGSQPALASHIALFEASLNRYNQAVQDYGFVSKEAIYEREVFRGIYSRLNGRIMHILLSEVR